MNYEFRYTAEKSEAEEELRMCENAMTFEDKVDALVNEGGYSREEAAEILEEMGEGE